MDGKTTEIRYQQWVQIIQDWSRSGRTKRDFCQENGINEKKFYYYQRRIRNLIANQGERRALPDGDTGSVLPLSGRQENRPQIVKLQFPGTMQFNSSLVSFSVNGLNFSVPENIPAPFLAKLLEAACHGAR